MRVQGTAKASRCSLRRVCVCVCVCTAINIETYRSMIALFAVLLMLHTVRDATSPRRDERAFLESARALP